MSKISVTDPVVQMTRQIPPAGAPQSGSAPGTSSASAGAPPANATAALAGIVVLAFGWLGISATVVEMAAGLGARWAIDHGGQIIFAPLFGVLAAGAWCAVLCRLHAHRYAAAAWWAAFACLPTMLALQIAGVL